jgi:hypothetical protein
MHFHTLCHVLLLALLAVVACHCLLLLVPTPPPSHLLPRIVPWSWSSSQAPCCTMMDWFRSLHVLCHVLRPSDGVLPHEHGAPDEHAVRSPRHDPILPQLTRCLIKWQRGMSFLGTPSLMSTCSVGRTTARGWCRWLPSFA